MKITPLEIRQKTFEKVFRGYDKDEVNAFLRSLSQEWERFLDENKELSIRIESLEKEVSKLREVESSLFKTLKTAEDTGANLIEQAKKETELKIKESSIKSDEILKEAQEKAKNLMSSAEAKTKQVLEEMLDRIKSLEKQYSQMNDLREKLIGQISAYSDELKERIGKFEKKSEEELIENIVAQAKELYNSAMMDVSAILNKEIKTSQKEVTEKEEIVNEKTKNEVEIKDNPFLDQEKKSMEKSSSQSFFDELE